MKCPHCIDEELIAIETEQVEVDYCTECKGIWLDSGELELLLGNGQSSKGTARDADEARRVAKRSRLLSKMAAASSR